MSRICARALTGTLLLSVSVLLAACGGGGGGGGDGGGGTGNGPGGPGSGTTIDYSKEAQQMAEKTAPGMPAACSGLLGDNDPTGMACDPFPLKSLLCNFPVPNPVTPQVAEALFGPCNGTPGKPNLTVFVRVINPANARNPNPLIRASGARAIFNENNADKFTETTENDPPAPGNELIFEITVKGPHKNPITVNYDTGGTGDVELDKLLTARETAVANEPGTPDYERPAAPRSLVFAATAVDAPVTQQVKVRVVNDTVCESDELMGFRITTIEDTEPVDTTLPNDGQPQLIQKGGIGEIEDEDCPPPVLTDCGSTLSGKTLQLEAGSYGVRGLGQFAPLTAALPLDLLNEKRSRLSRAGTITDSGDQSGTTLPTGTVFNSAETVLFPLAVFAQGFFAVENLAVGPLSLQAGTSVATLVAAKPLIQVGENGVVTNQPNRPEDARIVFDGQQASRAALTGLFIAGMEIPIPTDIPPDTEIPLGPFGRLVLNEQLPAGNVPAGVLSQNDEFAYRSVNLLHLYGANAGDELIIGHNFAGISCRTAPLNFDQLNPRVSGGGGGDPGPGPDPGPAPGLPMDQASCEAAAPEQFPDAQVEQFCGLFFGGGTPQPPGGLPGGIPSNPLTAQGCPAADAAAGDGGSVDPQACLAEFIDEGPIDDGDVVGTLLDEVLCAPAGTPAPFNQCLGDVLP